MSKALARIEAQMEIESEEDVHYYKCDQCCAPCRYERYDYSVEKDGVTTEDKGFCSQECFYEFIEDEIVDSKVDRAIREEWDSIHEHVCPACTDRLKQVMPGKEKKNG